MLLTLVLVFSVISLSVGQKGLSSNVSTACASSCDWNDPTIWIDGTVPGDGDYVSLIQSGTYTIQLTGKANINDLTFGVDDGKHDSGKQTFIIKSGAILTASASFNAYLSSVFQVESGASASFGGGGRTEGSFILGGIASFANTLEIGTKDAQVPLNIVYGSLQLQDGSLTANSVTISSTSTLSGNGNINVSNGVSNNGNIKPGLGGVGRINIFGDLSLTSSSELYFDVNGINAYDQMVMSGYLRQNGDLYVEPGKFTPLSHQRFYIMNHTSQLGGFDKTSEDCTITCLNNKWDVAVDQSWTALVYDDASALIASSLVILGSLIFTLL